MPINVLISKGEKKLALVVPEVGQKFSFKTAMEQYAASTVLQRDFGHRHDSFTDWESDSLFSWPPKSRFHKRSPLSTQKFLMKMMMMRMKRTWKLFKRNSFRRLVPL